MPRRQLRQQRKMRPGRLIDRRNAHQTNQSPRIGVSREGDEVSQAGRQHAGLLRLLAGVDLDKHIRCATDLLCSLRKCSHNLRPVDCLDNIEQCDRILGFVALQRPNEVERQSLDITTTAPMLLSFLNTVLTKNPVPAFKRCFNSLIGLALGYGDQFDRMIGDRPDRRLDGGAVGGYRIGKGSARHERDEA